MSITSRTSNTVELALDSAASGAVKHPRARLRTVSRNDLKLDWAVGAETADPASPACEWRTAYPDVGGDAGPFGWWFPLRLAEPAGSGIIFSPMGRKKKRPAARLDPVRKRLLRLLEAKGSNLRTASVAMGRNDAYMQQFIYRGTPKVLAANDREILAEHLGCRPELLKHGRSYRLSTNATRPSPPDDAYAVPEADLRVEPDAEPWNGELGRPARRGCSPIRSSATGSGPIPATCGWSKWTGAGAAGAAPREPDPHRPDPDRAAGRTPGHGDAARFWTKAGWCWFFAAVDHCASDVVGWHVAKNERPLGGAGAGPPRGAGPHGRLRQGHPPWASVCRTTRARSSPARPSLHSRTITKPSSTSTPSSARKTRQKGLR